MHQMRARSGLHLTPSHRAREDDVARVTREVHVELPLGQRRQVTAAGRLEDLGGEPFPLGHEHRSPLGELAQLARARDARGPTPDDRDRDEDERHENDRHQAATPAGYAALCHARSLALRARALRAVSCSDASTGFRVSEWPNGLPRQVQIG